MDSKLNIDSKISADAINQGTTNPNTNVNPLFKDQKRVIKRMIVMDTSKLKGLGIESTIKDAMSKLEKGKPKKLNQPILKPLVNGQSILHVSSKPIETVIKTEFEPKIVSTPPTDTVVKHEHRPSVPVAPSSSPTGQVLVQPKSNTPTSHQVIHLIRPAHPPAVSTTNAVFQTVKLITPQVPAMINIVQSSSVPVKSVHRIQPMIITATSTSPAVEQQHNMPIQTNCSSNIVQSQTNSSPLLKIESIVPSASDGKKIQILSDVSLNDAKAKLLEIDKLSSKNLKLTNVIKGTDKSSTKSAVHSKSDSEVNTELTPRSRLSVPLKTDVDKMPSPKLTNIIQRSDEIQSRSTVCSSSSVRQPTTYSVCTMSKPLKSGMKITSTVNLNANEGLDKSSIKSTFYVSNCTNQPVTSSPSPSAIPPNTENRRFAAKYLKIPNKISNYSNITEGCAPKSPFPRLAVKHPSYATTKPSTTGIDDISTRNVLFTSASKPKVYFTSCTSKPMFSSFVVTKSESSEVTYSDPNSPHYKAHHKPTKEYPLHLPFIKIVKPVTTSTCSTSAATEVATKQLVTTDENIEIIVPSRQKYLSKKDKSGLYERTPIHDPTKPFQDVLWATNNPRTYARHNVKRLLSDKIIKKNNLQGESVQNVQTSEIVVPVEKDTNDEKCVEQGDTDTCRDETGSKSENSKSVLSESESIGSQSISGVTSLRPAHDHIIQPTDVIVPSVTESKNNFFGFSIEEVNASASVLSQIKAILSRKRTLKAPEVENVNDSKTVDCDKDGWILNCETGLLEQQTKNVPVDLNHQDVPPTAELDIIADSNLPPANSVFETTPKVQISPGVTTQVFNDKSKVRLDSSTCDDSPVPSKVPIIEDADDEISDIALVHRSKAKCTGNAPTVKNRRAILKSVELHRNAFIPATTDDESELSLCIRPPRPKLRKSRQKQTVEQLKIQQSAHVSLLKRFTQTDADCDNFNDESLVYFINGIEERIKVLEDQVECSFNPQNRDDLNVETINLSEQIVSINIDPVPDKIESVTPSEIVTESNEIVRPSESVSSVNCSLNCVVACEPQPHQPALEATVNDAEIADCEEGQSMIHEVTIQRDSFLVTEYNTKCDAIDHLPLKVKLEKETSPAPSCSVDRSRFKKHTRTTIRKKRKRKSLVEMLAQHVDQDTLKSVIIAHAKQKCGFSSSLDSDSDDASDVESKIFRTVCTIDLCDDDDETLHEDVLQYLNVAGEDEVEVDQDSNSVAPSLELPDQNEHLKLSEEKLSRTKIKSETCFNAAAIVTISENSTAKLSEELDAISEDVISNSEKEPDDEDSHESHDPQADIHNDITLPSPLTISNVPGVESEPKNSFKDVEMIDTAVEIESNALPTMEDTSPSPLTISNVPVVEPESNNTSEDVEMLDTAVEIEASARPTMKDTSPSPLTISNVPVVESEANNTSDDVEKIDTTVVECNTRPTMEDTSPSPVTISNVPVVESESNNTSEDVQKIDTVVESNTHLTMEDTSLDVIRLPSITKEADTAIDAEISDAVPKCDNSKTAVLHSTSVTEEPDIVIANSAMGHISKLNDTNNDFSATKKPERAVLKLRPFEEISSRSKTKKDDNEFTTKDKKLSFEENLIEADSVISEKSKSKPKRKAKATKSKLVDSKSKKSSENSNDSKQTPSKPANEKVQFSSVSVNDDSAVGAIKIKIKLKKIQKQRKFRFQLQLLRH